MVPKHVDSVIRDTSDYAPKVRKVIGLFSSFVCEFIQSMIVMSSNSLALTVVQILCQRDRRLLVSGMWHVG